MHEPDQNIVVSARGLYDDISKSCCFASLMTFPTKNFEEVLKQQLAEA